jgi:hypothetical protein
MKSKLLYTVLESLSTEVATAQTSAEAIANIIVGAFVRGLFCACTLF